MGSYLGSKGLTRPLSTGKLQVPAHFREPADPQRWCEVLKHCTTALAIFAGLERAITHTP